MSGLVPGSKGTGSGSGPHLFLTDYSVILCFFPLAILCFVLQVSLLSFYITRARRLIGLHSCDLNRSMNPFFI